MKTLFVGLLLVTLLYLIALPVHQYICLHRATDALARGNPDAAWAHLEPALNGWPNFFGARAKELCGQITLQQAKVLTNGPKPDFNQAARLLSRLGERCQGHEEKEAQDLLERLATLHLDRATGRCRERDFDGAFRDFQQISTLTYPERFLLEAKSEAAWCRVEFARDLAEKEYFEEAVEQLARAIDSENGVVRKTALRQILWVVEKELLSWLDRTQYVKAFDLLSQRWQSFGDEPEIAFFFPRLESQPKCGFSASP